MSSSSQKAQYARLLWIPLILYYVVALAGQLVPALHEISLELTNSGIKRSPSESAFIEHLEAILWAVGCVAYIYWAYRQRGAGVTGGQASWLVFFAVVCFFALGEELSWGQHLLDYQPPERISEINTQNEFNLHNLHLGKTLGVSPDNPLYPYMGSLTRILNPLFYLFCIIAWLALPLCVERLELRRFALLRHYPGQTDFFYRAFALAIVGYLVIDNVFFDVGELFELTVATAGAATGLTQRAGTPA